MSVRNRYHPVRQCEMKADAQPDGGVEETKAHAGVEDREERKAPPPPPPGHGPPPPAAAQDPPIPDWLRARYFEVLTEFSPAGKQLATNDGRKPGKDVKWRVRLKSAQEAALHAMVLVTGELNQFHRLELANLRAAKDTELADLRTAKDTEIANLRAAKDTVITDLRAKKDTELADLRGVIEGLRERLGFLKGQAESREESVERIKKDAQVDARREAEKEIQRLKVSNAFLTGKAESCERREAEEEFNTVRASVARFEAVVPLLERQVEDLKQQLAQEQKRNDRMQNRNDRLLALLERVEADRAGARA